jgi:dTMP kinase
MASGEKTIMKRFITFEGIDGSGKSTISKRVYQRLKGEGFNVVLTAEPTDTPIGKYVKQCIATKADPFVTAFTFIADRIQHCQQIQHWLNEETLVLCDRYADSTYAYQGVQLEQHLENPVHWLQELSDERVLTPDRTYLFFIDPDLALRRIQDREELIPFEKEAFLTKVQQVYLTLANEPRFQQIDASKLLPDIVELCYQDIVKLCRL